MCTFQQVLTPRLVGPPDPVSPWDPWVWRKVSRASLPLPPLKPPPLTDPLPSARAPELFPEGAQKMQQLAAQVGLNPSQGALLPKSGEHCPHPGSGLQEQGDHTPRQEGPGPRAQSTDRRLSGSPGLGAAGWCPGPGPSGGTRRQGRAEGPPGGGCTTLFLRLHSLPQTSAPAPSPR